jgi:hypothetical protein
LADLAGKDAELSVAAEVEEQPRQKANRHGVQSATAKPIVVEKSSASAPEILTEQNVLARKPLSMAKGIHLEPAVGQQHELRHPELDLPLGVLLAEKPIATTKNIYESTGYINELKNRATSLRPIEQPEYPQDRAVSSEQPLRRIVVEPPTLRHRPERQPLHADVPIVSAEPVVNVTIGRVEIRAVQAPSIARQRTEPYGVKPMSLGGYLKQRGGGR